MSTYKDIYVNTSFGRSHIIETGNIEASSLLVFHGRNSTSSYNLLICKFLLSDFHIFAADIIGHPGKSDEVCFSSHGYDYGRWAAAIAIKYYRLLNLY